MTKQQLETIQVMALRMIVDKIKKTQKYPYQLTTYVIDHRNQILKSNNSAYVTIDMIEKQIMELNKHEIQLIKESIFIDDESEVVKS